MMALLVAMLFAVTVPLFARTWRTMFIALGLQGLLMAIIALSKLGSHADDVAIWVLIADLAILRGIFAPVFLHRMVQGRARSPELELVPGNLVFWGIAVVIVATALWFGAKIPPIDPLASLHLGVALTMVLLGLYVLTLQTRPLGQVIGALIIENGVVCLELLLTHHVALPVELALTGVFIGSVLAFGLLLRRLETPLEGA